MVLQESCVLCAVKVCWWRWRRSPVSCVLFRCAGGGGGGRCCFHKLWLSHSKCSAEMTFENVIQCTLVLTFAFT